MNQTLERGQPITVLTPVYLDRPERWDYLQTTLHSFYRCCVLPFTHYLIDDRSPAFHVELAELCRQYGIIQLPAIAVEARRGFFDAFSQLLRHVNTEFYVYLEPDHYFYLTGDYWHAMLRLFQLEPELVGIYLRAPMAYQHFQRCDDGQQLLTYDGNRLSRRIIDAENTGWLGRGYQHEGFTLMPTLWRTQPMHEYFLRPGFWLDVANPYELEYYVDHDWYRNPRLMAYLNAQAFCYHIGQTGGMGGGHTHPRDQRYEHVWSSKIL